MQGEHMLIERCRQQAKLNPPRVVLPDALDERVIHAARYLKQNGLAEPVLLANPFALRDFSLRTGVIMDGLSTIDPDSADEWRAEFADAITARLGEKAPEDADEAMRASRCGSVPPWLPPEKRIYVWRGISRQLPLLFCGRAESDRPEAGRENIIIYFHHVAAGTEGNVLGFADCRCRTSTHFCTAGGYCAEQCGNLHGNHR